MSAEELLPCPFCGGAPTYAPTDPQSQGDAWSELSCENVGCGATVEVVHYDDDPVIHKRECREAWNRRTPIKPSADTGELRERVNGLLARYFPEILMDQNGNACGVSFVVREQRAALTDAILDLIQSERP